MPQRTDLPLPANVPQPAHDRAADHLVGMALPKVSLASSFGATVELTRIRAPRLVIYCCPMMEARGNTLPEGWKDIPGALGCTLQARNFQEHYGEFFDLGVDVFGLSAQSSECQREMAKRLNLPFEILSDADFQFCDALRLPTFQIDSMRLLKRLTMVVRGTRIEHVFFPVFSPEQSADAVLQWLNDHPL